MKRQLLFLTTIVSLAFTSTSQIQGYTVGQTVADFTVTDINGTVHTLSDYTSAGKWVVLDFFFVACVPCQQTTPIFNELHEKYGCNQADLICISMNTGQDTDAQVIAFENTYGGTFSHAAAVSGDGGAGAVNTAFNPSAYPTFCLIGADMQLKNADIWPLANVGTFETAINSAGYNPTPTACGVASVNTLESSSLDVVLYPNPSKDATSIKVGLESNQEVNVIVYNAIGAVVENQSFQGLTGENSFSVNTSDLENGHYMVNVQLADGKATVKQLTVLR